MSKTKEVEKEINKESEAETTNPVAEVVDKEQTEAPKTETSGDVTTQDIVVIEPEKPKKEGWFKKNWKKVVGTAALVLGGAAVVVAALGKHGDDDDDTTYELTDDDVEEIGEESDGD